MTDNKTWPVLTPENIEPVDRDERATGRLLIQPFKQAEETSEGLIMSEGDGHATPVYGRVIKASDNSKYKSGDFLLFRRYAIDSLKTYTADGDVEVYLLEESEIIGIVRSAVEPRTKQSNIAQITEKRNGKEEKGSEKGSS